MKTPHKKNFSKSPRRHESKKFDGTQRANVARPHDRKNNQTNSDEPRSKARIVCGIHSVNEVLKVRPRKIEKVLLKEGWESSAELRALEEVLKDKRVSYEVKSQAQLDKWTSGHQGIAAFVTEQPEFNWKKTEASTQSVILALDGLEDPHNLGAIIRTSWLLGVDGILHTEDRSVGLTPTVNKIACGGVEHVPLEGINNFTNHIEQLKKNGYWVFGLAANGKSTLYDLKMPDKVVWIIGAEDKGMRKTTERLCDELISIPQLEASASFNASVAAGITLGETFRQHQKQKK